ncbi:hypothetical protein [Terrilactibacillus laevilacticus]|uniref:Uncharacterized protein n=1 Tax=Terrilactibacillus laevilacticus TaxID=1380157 RepID=A0ABW5PSE3_9BACI|nr:hypothetical protein [Terrilactibacillus laevilacticus]
MSPNQKRTFKAITSVIFIASSIAYMINDKFHYSLITLVIGFLFCISALFQKNVKDYAKKK